MSENLDELYQEIADVLVDIIPESWKKVVLYAEMYSDYEKVYFYYYPLKKGSEPVFSGDIKTKYKVNKELHDQLHEELDVNFKQLWLDTKEEDEDSWTSVTFSITNEGEIDLRFGYENLREVNEAVKLAKWVEKNIK